MQELTADVLRQLIREGLPGTQRELEADMRSNRYFDWPEWREMMRYQLGLDDE